MPMQDTSLSSSYKSWLLFSDRIKAGNNAGAVIVVHPAVRDCSRLTSAWRVVSDCQSDATCVMNGTCSHRSQPSFMCCELPYTIKCQCCQTQTFFTRYSVLSDAGISYQMCDRSVLVDAGVPYQVYEVYGDHESMLTQPSNLALGILKAIQGMHK